MRNQRRSGVSVVLDRPGVTEDALGNETSGPTSQTILGCQFDPDPPQERAGDDQVTVLLVGTLNLPGVHQLTADDRVTFDGSAWQVIGDGNVWRDRTKVRVQQARKS